MAYTSVRVMIREEPASMALRFSLCFGTVSVPLDEGTLVKRCPRCRQSIYSYGGARGTMQAVCRGAHVTMQPMFIALSQAFRRVSEFSRVASFLTDTKPVTVPGDKDSARASPALTLTLD